MTHLTRFFSDFVSMHTVCSCVSTEPRLLNLAVSPKIVIILSISFGNLK